MNVAILASDALRARAISDALESGGIGSAVYHRPASAHLARALRKGMPVDLITLLCEMRSPDAMPAARADILELRRIDARHPIVAVTLSSDEKTVVSLLECGADDVVAYPVRQREFAARLRALKRWHSQAGVGSESHSCVIGRVSLQRSSRTLAIDGQPMLKLTEYEFGVGWLLFNNPGKALSREYMMENVWRLPNTVNSRCVDTCVSALRKKIKSTGCDQIEITGVYGTGYRLDIHESSMGGVGGQPHSEIRDRADDYQWTGC